MFIYLVKQKKVINCKKWFCFYCCNLGAYLGAEYIPEFMSKPCESRAEAVQLAQNIYNIVQVRKSSKYTINSTLYYTAHSTQYTVNSTHYTVLHTA